MKKHQALQAELAGHEPRIQNVCSSGQAMIREGNFAVDTISGKIKDLQDRWQQLKVSSLLFLIPPANFPHLIMIPARYSFGRLFLLFLVAYNI